MGPGMDNVSLANHDSYDSFLGKRTRGKRNINTLVKQFGVNDMLPSQDPQLRAHKFNP
jgi:hypothetical protein